MCVSHEPSSKLLVKGLYRDDTGSLYLAVMSCKWQKLKGYSSLYKELGQ